MTSPKASKLDSLRDNITTIVDQTQLTTANHRKNSVALYKLHVQASSIVQPTKNGAIKVIGERTFADAFLELLSRIMLIKKGTAAVDRVVKFVGAYVKYVNNKASEDQAKDGEEEEETFASRFISRLIKWLVSGFQAKDKITRYRAVQIVSETIAHIGELDEDTYKLIRDGLIGRIVDKEPLVRTHTVIALSKLAGSEDPSELGVDEKSILDILLGVVHSDESPDVRRTALVNIPLTPTTLPIVLSRTRDTDTLTRKLVYATALRTKLEHPKQLSIAQREQIVKDGLGDREPSVRLAAAKLITGWLDLFTSEAKDQANSEYTWQGDDGGTMRGLAEFLTAFDLFGPGADVAVDALSSVFVTRPDILTHFTFNEKYWQNLSPESVLLARVFAEHCASTGKNAIFDQSGFPVVMVVAFCLQEAYNKFLDVTEALERSQKDDEDISDDEDREGEAVKQEIILSELLRIASNLDYADEIGRRKMFAIIRDMLAQETLPENLIERGLDVLYQLVPDERDLIRIVVEIVAELRNDPDDFEEQGDKGDTTLSTQTTQTMEAPSRKPKSRQDMSPEEAHRADALDMRCLTLCIGMLERVQGSFEDNRTLEGVLADLIIPAVRRTELAIREKGLVGLALVCLITKKMALSSFQLFLNQVQNSPPKLKLKVLQTIFDLLIMYEHDAFKTTPDLLERVVGFLVETMKVEQVSEVQATLCVGMCKLLLSGLVTDTKVLSTLLLLYVSPDTVDNHELRQCLSYFFPVYAYSSPANQNRLRSLFVETLDTVASLYDELEDDQEMISLQQFGLLVIDWTNPLKAAEVGISDATNHDVHAHLGVDILLALRDSERPGERQKVLLQLLTHLHLAPGIGNRALAKLVICITHLEEESPFEEIALGKIFLRFKTRFFKLFEGEVKGLDLRDYVDEEFEALYAELGSKMPEPKEGVSNRTGGGSNKEKDRLNEAGSTSAPSPPSTKERDERAASSEEEPITNGTAVTTKTASVGGEDSSHGASLAKESEDDEASEAVSKRVLEADEDNEQVSGNESVTDEEEQVRQVLERPKRKKVTKSTRTVRNTTKKVPSSSRRVARSPSTERDSENSGHEEQPTTAMDGNSSNRSSLAGTSDETPPKTEGRKRRRSPAPATPVKPKRQRGKSSRTTSTTTSTHAKRTNARASAARRRKATPSDDDGDGEDGDDRSEP